MSEKLIEQIRTLAQFLRESKSTIVFTGAGISTESGIPDFRSPGGVWATSEPVLYHDYLRSPEARAEYWRQKSLAHDDMLNASPNIAHLQLAKWESTEGESGKLLRGVITQNIDRLHQRAGSQNVLELHGNAMEMLCLECGKRTETDPWVKEYRQTELVPDCPNCGGIMKHATISFGQSLDETVLQNAASWASESELLIVIGSSLVVEPAASLPIIAKRNGAKLVIINRDATPHDMQADIVIHQSIGDVFRELARVL